MKCAGLGAGRLHPAPRVPRVGRSARECVAANVGGSPARVRLAVRIQVDPSPPTCHGRLGHKPFWRVHGLKRAEGRGLERVSALHLPAGKPGEQIPGGGLFRSIHRQCPGKQDAIAPVELRVHGRRCHADETHGNAAAEVASLGKTPWRSSGKSRGHRRAWKFVLMPPAEFLQSAEDRGA